MSILFASQMCLLVFQYVLLVLWLKYRRGQGGVLCCCVLLFALYLVDVWGDHEWSFDGESIRVAMVMASAFLPWAVVKLLRYRIDPVTQSE